MKASNIAPGMTLKLKREACERYQISAPFGIPVDEIVYHNGYKTPWIRNGDKFFRPSDFERSMGTVAWSPETGWTA